MSNPREVLERMARATYGHIGPEEKIQAALRELVEMTRYDHTPETFSDLVVEITELEL